MNTKLIQKVNNKFGKSFYKTMNNAVLGKNYGKFEKAWKY